MSITDRLKNNLGLKLLALVFALIIWGLVRNQADPPVMRHRTVSIEVLGVPENLAVAAVTPAQVAATLYGRSSALQQLDRSGFRIVARVTETDVRATRVQVEPENLPPGIEIRDLTPLSVKVELDAEVVAKRPVYVELRGNPAEGFTATQPEARPNEVTVSGPSRQVEKVARVVAEVDISGRNVNDPLDIPLVGRDAASLLVPGIEITPAQASVTVPLRRIDSRTVPVAPVITSVPRGFSLESVSVRPVVVTVSGTARLLTGLDTVQTAAVSPAATAGRTSYTVPLRLSSGLSSSAGSVVVTVVLARASRSSTTTPATPRTTEPEPEATERPSPAPPPPAPPADQPTAPKPGENDDADRPPPAKTRPASPAKGPRPEPRGTD